MLITAECEGEHYIFCIAGKAQRRKRKEEKLLKQMEKDKKAQSDASKETEASNGLTHAPSGKGT